MKEVDLEVGITNTRNKEIDIIDDDEIEIEESIESKDKIDKSDEEIEIEINGRTELSRNKIGREILNSNVENKIKYLREVEDRIAEPNEKYVKKIMIKKDINREIYNRIKEKRKSYCCCIPLSDNCVITIRDVQVMEVFIENFIDHPRGAILLADVTLLGRRIQHERNFFFKLYFLFTFTILAMTSLLAGLSQIDDDDVRLAMLIIGIIVTVLKGIMETFSINANYEIGKKKMAIFRQLTWDFLTKSVYYDTEVFYKKVNDFRSLLFTKLRDFDDENVSMAIDFRKRDKEDIFDQVHN
jgi:hypothetical protein